KDLRAALEQQDEIPRIPPCFARLGPLTSGFQAGGLVDLGGCPSKGKGAAPRAPGVTPSGFVRMGEIEPGSLVIGADGKPHRVLAVFPQGKKPVFSVRFSDGAAVECCDEHLWYTMTRGESGSVKSLAEIRQSLPAEHRI